MTDIAPIVPEPEPVEVRVCSICEQDWGEHLRRASDRTKRVLWNFDSDVNGGAMSDEDMAARTAALKAAEMSVVNDCVPLLKKANAGPEGPPGVVGPPGVDGRDAGDGETTPTISPDQKWVKPHWK